MDCTRQEAAPAQFVKFTLPDGKVITDWLDITEGIGFSKETLSEEIGIETEMQDWILVLDGKRLHDDDCLKMYLPLGALYCEDNPLHIKVLRRNP